MRPGSSGVRPGSGVATTLFTRHDDVLTVGLGVGDLDAAVVSELAERFLLPFLPGTSLLDPVVSRSGQKKVAFLDPCEIGFTVSGAGRRLRIRRSQTFDQNTSSDITEKRLVQAFVDSLEEVAGAYRESYWEDLVGTLPERMVVKSVADADQQPLVLQTLRQLTKWASGLYEGQPIAVSVGFTKKTSRGVRVGIHEYWQEAAGPVLSNGFDTILTVGPDGRLVGAVGLDMPPAGASPFVPYRLQPVAHWTTTSGGLALVLNRLGEILVLRNGQLVFARRSGLWHFLGDPSVIVSQIRRPNNRLLRQAVLDTALDTSFARSGGCLGVHTTGHGRLDAIVSPDDFLVSGTNAKTKAMARIVAGKNFTQLDRRLRQELVAVDGATILDHTGSVLAVGAIVKVGAGSTGGGRAAAAKKLGTLGLGVKISQDGSIVCYREASEVFALM